MNNEKSWSQHFNYILVLQDIVGMCTGGVFEHRKKCNLEVQIKLTLAEENLGVGFCHMVFNEKTIFCVLFMKCIIFI